MEKDKVFYYSGASARPVPVQVLVLSDHLLISDEEGGEQPLAFSLSHITENKVGKQHFIYLDNSGLSYLHFHEHHELATLLGTVKTAAGKDWYTRLMKQKLTLLIPLLFALATVLYILVITAIPIVGTLMISKEKEITVGNHLNEMMLQQALLSGSSIDSTKTKKLQAFADHLRLSDTYPIRVTVVKSHMLNAYALPGGYVVVYTELLDKVQSPEALAALLAHESTHINERHTLKSLLRNAANSILVSVIFGDISGISGAIAGHAQSLNGLSYSRSLEKEADLKGLKLMQRNNIGLKGMEELMHTLEQQGDIPGSLSFLSSHPLTKDRIRTAAEYARKHPQVQTKDKVLHSLFSALK